MEYGAPAGEKTFILDEQLFLLCVARTRGDLIERLSSVRLGASRGPVCFATLGGCPVIVASLRHSCRIGPERSTASYYAGLMGELLGGTLDARQLDLVRSDGSDAPESFVSRNPTLTKLLPLRDQVFAIGSDNAANVQAAVGMMNKEYGLLTWCCLSHAVSRIMEKVLGVLLEVALVPAEAIISSTESSRSYCVKNARYC